MLAIILFSVFCVPGTSPKIGRSKYTKTLILPFVLYSCETWSLTLREENRLRVSADRMLRRMFVPKREEVAGEDGIVMSFLT
jgi:hypothetical protein